MAIVYDEHIENIIIAILLLGVVAFLIWWFVFRVPSPTIATAPQQSEYIYRSDVPEVYYIEDHVEY